MESLVTRKELNWVAQKEWIATLGRANGTGSALIEPTPALFGHAIHLQYFYVSTNKENNILTFYQFVGSNIHPVHVITFIHNLEEKNTLPSPP